MMIDKIEENILDNLYTARTNRIDIKDTYHHNTSYKNILYVVKYGVLSLQELSKIKNTEITPQELILYDDENHVNGSDKVSLCKVGLNDLYENELEYDPYNPRLTDIIVSDNIKAYRSTTNYGNEFLVKGGIPNYLFKTIDIRLIKLLENKKNIKEVIEYYNKLILIAELIKKLDLDIKIREMSNENITLDIEKIIKMPKMIIK